MSYAFTAIWMLETIGWWLARRGAPRWLELTYLAGHAFIMFNGSIVFESGFSRVFGIVGFACVALSLAGRVPIPHELPPGAEQFFGRQVELERLIERLRARKNTAVTGSAGLGKTALAAQALQAVVGEPPNLLPAARFPTASYSWTSTPSMAMAKRHGAPWPTNSPAPPSWSVPPPATAPAPPATDAVVWLSLKAARRQTARMGARASTNSSASCRRKTVGCC